MAKNPRYELDALYRQTVDLSSPTAMRGTPAYKALLAQGQEAIGPLLSAIDKVPIPVMMLLTDITGKNPVKPAERGYIDKMVAAWKAWGAEEDGRK